MNQKPLWSRAFSRIPLIKVQQFRNTLKTIFLQNGPSP